MSDRRKRWVKPQRKSAVGSDDEELFNRDEVPDSRKMFGQDKIDKFHSDQDKIYIEKGAAAAAKQQKVTQEEVFSLKRLGDDESDVSDFDMTEAEVRDFYARTVLRQEMADDLVKPEQEQDAKMADRKWGETFNNYYQTDYIDEDYAGLNMQQIEQAKEEEEEAKKVQQRLQEELDEKDFGLDEFAKIDSLELLKDDSETVEERDVSKLSEQEKMLILKNESPELLPLVKDCKAKFTELTTELAPILNLYKSGALPPSRGIDYVKLRYALVSQYCANICFYLLLKAKRVPVYNHPVFRRIAQFRKLLVQMENARVSIAEKICALLKMASEGKPFKRLKEDDTDVSRIMERMENADPSASESEYEEEEEPLEGDMAEEMEQKRKRQEEEAIMALFRPSKRAKMDEGADDNDEEEEENDDEDNRGMTNQKKTIEEFFEDEADEPVFFDTEQDEEREQMSEFVDEEEDEKKKEQEDGGVDRKKITKEMEENKGLKVSRGKQKLNPRQRNKRKYKRALMRRASQVPRLRNEANAYGGEARGISTNIVKSTKLK